MSRPIPCPRCGAHWPKARNYRCPGCGVTRMEADPTFNVRAHNKALRLVAASHPRSFAAAKRRLRGTVPAGALWNAAAREVARKNRAEYRRLVDGGKAA